MPRAKILDDAWVATATTGTGTVTLGAALPGHNTFANGGAVNGDVVRYYISDGNAKERGYGTYTASGTTLTRTLEFSTTGSLLNLSGNAVVFSDAAAADLWPRSVAITPLWLATGTAPAIGNGTLTGRVTEMPGRWHRFQLQQTMGSTTTYGTGNYSWQLPAPYNTAALFYAQGSVYALDPGTAYHTGICYISSTGNQVFVISEGGGDVWGVTRPMTWGTGDELRLQIDYEV